MHMHKSLFCTVFPIVLGIKLIDIFDGQEGTAEHSNVCSVLTFLAI